MATVETDFRLLFWDASRTRWSFRPEVRTSTSSAPTTKQVRRRLTLYRFCMYGLLFSRVKMYRMLAVRES